MEFFKAEKLSERLMRITEVTGVCCYLAIGEERACLLDTGCGYGDLKKFVETLTDKPVFVILTHGHHDHMGAAAIFEEVYMNPADELVFQRFGIWQNRLAEMKEMLAGFGEEHLVPTRKKAIKEINDGDVFDLGSLTIKMILVKGHTPGMMCPLLVEERSIIFGDACGVGVLLVDEFSSVVSEYRESLLKLKEYEPEYDQVYRNHGTFFSEKVLLDNVIECCNLILAGKDDRMPVTMHGFDLFAAKAVDDYGRVDKKEGNIMYAADKVK